MPRVFPTCDLLNSTIYRVNLLPWHFDYEQLANTDLQNFAEINLASSLENVHIAACGSLKLFFSIFNKILERKTSMSGPSNMGMSMTISQSMLKTL